MTDQADTTGGARSQAVIPLPVRQALIALARCSLRTAASVALRRLHQPRGRQGQLVHFSDGTCSAVYKETVVDHPDLTDPVVLVVGFRLRRVHRRWAHALFRLESEANTVLFAGFDGFVSKLWLRHDPRGLYRGIYQWDGVEAALAYVRALWWALAAVSEKDSIRYVLLPGFLRDDVLADPTPLDTTSGPTSEWWRPVTAETTRDTSQASAGSATSSPSDR